MRRTLAVTTMALSVTLSVLGSAAWSADDQRPDRPALPPAAATSPHAALATAQAVVDGSDGTDTGDATLALRDLFVALPALSRTDRAAAQDLLARPSENKRACSDHVCVHWTTSGSDATTTRWADRTLTVMNQVWNREIGGLGYRAPAPDQAGGSDKLDVYLQDVGAQGLYGECVPENTVPDHPRRASGYCILDNDFARAQFGSKPSTALRATAAHEFFHASQFNYDYKEDHWFMEATATWMEERVYDDVNDNRQYLPAGQMQEPTQALDTFNQYGSNQYGNWAFFEFLSQSYGNDIVRQIWTTAVGRDNYSTKALRKSLPTSFLDTYAAFAAANVTPARSYSEGRYWPHPASVHLTLGRAQTQGANGPIDHMANAPIRVRPADTLGSRAWHLRVRVDGPGRRTAPATTLVVMLANGNVDHVRVRLDRTGFGHAVVPFSYQRVKQVYVVPTNASTRFDCAGNDPTYSCSGTPLDDGRNFAISLSTVKR